MLTPSTPLAYPQVVSRSFALFRVVNFSVLAGRATFCSGFDSRQLHWKDAGQGHKHWPVSYAAVTPMTYACAACVTGRDARVEDPAARKMDQTTLVGPLFLFRAGEPPRRENIAGMNRGSRPALRRRVSNGIRLPVPDYGGPGTPPRPGSSRRHPRASWPVAEARGTRTRWAIRVNRVGTQKVPQSSR